MKFSYFMVGLEEFTGLERLVCKARFNFQAD